MSGWKTISNGEHFPGITIKENTDSGGYRMEFLNLEPRTKFHIRVFMVILLALAAVAYIGFAYFQNTRIGPVAVLASIIWAIGGGIVLDRPWKTTRTIDLDIGAQRFRVWRNQEITCERPIEDFKNLSIDDHPDLELEREERRRKRLEGPGRLEKQHCLTGWFGPEATHRVELIYRMEWPKRYSLQDVTGAVNWVLKRMAAAASPTSPSERRSEPKAEPALRSGINPPLD
jgi:hypothetical protein